MVRLSIETKKKKILNILSQFRSNIRTSTFLMIIITLIKLFPLFYISHQWKTQNLGLLTYLKKLLISTYTDATDTILILLFSLTFGITFLTVLYIYRIYSLKGINFLFKFIHPIIRLLYYTHFIFVQYLYEIIIAFGLKDSCDPVKGVCENIVPVKILMSVLAFILTFLISVLMNLILRKPHYIQPYLFIGKLNSLNLDFSIFPILQGIVVLEKYIPFEYYLSIKIVVRVLFIAYYVKYIFNYYMVINGLEFVIKTVSFISSIVEFVFVKDFYNFDYALFIQNPTAISLLFDGDFIYKKLLTEVIIALICYFILQKQIYKKDPTCFYLTKRNDYVFFTFYNKLFQYLLSIQHNKIEVVHIYNQILSHKKTCEFEECYCHGLIDQYHKLLENNNSKKTAEYKIKELYDLMLKKINEILTSLIDKTNDQHDTFQVLFVYILFSIYFGKHYIQSFFTIQKIQKSTIYKDNFIIRLQISFIKHELVSNFIEYNKQITNEDYNTMYISYKEYSRYMKIEDSIINTIDKFKVLSKSVLNKQLNSEEYNKYIRKFYKALDRSYRLIDKDLKFHTQNVSNIKLLYFFKFFDYDKFTYLKDDQYFKIHYDSTARLQVPDVMIIKHSKTTNDFIIEYVTPLICENLNYISTDVIGRELHELMPDGFKEPHFNHMTTYISNNSMTVMNKEVFFIDSNGYINMYRINGSVMLTLKQELYLFVQLVSLRNIYDNRGISYVCLSKEGYLMNMNKCFEDYFVYKQLLIKFIKTNLFIDILGIKKEEVDCKLEGELYQMELRYGDVMEMLQKLDYSKLWDSDNLYYTTYMELLNHFRYKKNNKIVIRIERKNFMKKFYFYVVKFSVQEGPKYIPTKGNLFHFTTNHFSKEDQKQQNEQKIAKNIMAKIKYSSFQSLKKDKPIELDLSVNEPIYQHQMIKTSIKEKEFTCCSLTYILFIVLTFVGGTILLEYIKIEKFKYADVLSTLNIQMYNIDIFTSFLRTSEINIFMNNDVERNKLFIDKLLDNYRLMIKEIVINYFSLPSELGDKYNTIFGNQFVVKELKLDFSNDQRGRILFDILDSYKSHSYRIISAQDFNFDLETYPKLINNSEEEASYQDKAILFTLENNKISSYFNNFYEISAANSSELLLMIKAFLTAINFLMIILLLLAIIYSIKEYLWDQTLVYNRLFIVFNIVKFNNIYLLSKVVIFEDLFKDFTIKNKKKLQELNIGSNDYKEPKARLSEYFGKNIVKETQEAIRLTELIKETNAKINVIDTSKETGYKADKTELSSNNRTQTAFIKKDIISQKYIIQTDMLKKSKRHYLFFTFYLLLSFFTILCSLVITIIILAHFDLINNNVNNTYIYFIKNKILNEMILTYQISMIKREEVKLDDAVYFSKLKNDYYAFMDKLDNLKVNEQFTISNVNDFELDLTANDLCQVMANHTTVSVSDCTAIGNGINTKGYPNMIDTMYQVLFFLYNDLSYQINNHVKYNITNIKNSLDYERIMINYQTILSEIHKIVVTLFLDNKNNSFSFIQSWEDILICCLALETTIILLFYTIFYRTADNRIKILNKVEKIVENTIFCTI
jgi:hypothetical protein